MEEAAPAPDVRFKYSLSSISGTHQCQSKVYMEKNAPRPKVSRSSHILISSPPDFASADGIGLSDGVVMSDVSADMPELDTDPIGIDSDW